MEVNREIPAIQFWDLHRLRQRECLEMGNGAFGKGKFVGLCTAQLSPCDDEVEVCGTTKFESSDDKVVLKLNFLHLEDFYYLLC
jgi:hypothetical protein